MVTVSMFRCYKEFATSGKPFIILPNSQLGSHKRWLDSVTAVAHFTDLGGGSQHISVADLAR